MGLPWDHREGLVEEAQPLGPNALCVSKEVGKAKPGEPHFLSSQALLKPQACHLIVPQRRLSDKFNESDRSP